jgi:signal transduction histidine kinase
MSQLAIVSTNLALAYPPAAQAGHDLMAHDLRNLLATVGLHLETLQRLSGPSGAKAADAAHALLTRGATLCNGVLDPTPSTDGRARRKGVDLMQTAGQVADLLAPTAPKDFSSDIGQSGSVSVLAAPDDLFRILFNLMSNAVTVANRVRPYSERLRFGSTPRSRW